MSFLWGKLPLCPGKTQTTIDFSYNKNERPQGQMEIEEYEFTKVEVK